MRTQSANFLFLSLIFMSVGCGYVHAYCSQLQIQKLGVSSDFQKESKSMTVSFITILSIDSSLYSVRFFLLIDDHWTAVELERKARLVGEFGAMIET